MVYHYFMIQREITPKLRSYLRSFPVVVVIGPRQSGKTTLLQNLFPKRRYLSLEDPDNRLFAQEDPRRFLETYPPPVIFDEIQRVPELLSYLQTKTDQIKKSGAYLLTGSQNILLSEKVSQTLAGRVGTLTLPVFTISELDRAGLLKNDLYHLLFTGFYPRIWDKNLKPDDWYPNYVQTYLERDLRQIKNITNLMLFQKFLKLCAGRTGQILNLSSFASDCGINHNTVYSWLSVLEASYIIFTLPPYYKNINKRVVKSPKIYFYDVGLACSLLGIENIGQVATHPLMGSLFETMIVSEIVKRNLNRGRPGKVFYLRDRTGHEVDCLIEQQAGKFKAVEIKAGSTPNSGYFENLVYWQKVLDFSPSVSFVVYGGGGQQKRTQGTLLGWSNIHKVF